MYSNQLSDIAPVVPLMRCTTGEDCNTLPYVPSSVFAVNKVQSAITRFHPRAYLNMGIYICFTSIIHNSVAQYLSFIQYKRSSVKVVNFSTSWIIKSTRYWWTQKFITFQLRYYVSFFVNKRTNFVPREKYTLPVVSTSLVLFSRWSSCSMSSSSSSCWCINFSAFSHNLQGRH